MIVQSLW